MNHRENESSLRVVVGAGNVIGGVVVANFEKGRSERMMNDDGKQQLQLNSYLARDEMT